MKRFERARGIAVLGLLAVRGFLGPGAALSAQAGGENELAIFLGGWIGEDFAERSTPAIDPFLGPIELGSALGQRNGVVIGLQYTGFFSSWFGAEVTIAHVAGRWTSLAGRVTDGVLTGESTDITGVSAVPFALNAFVRPRVFSRGPNPFLSAGAGAIYYEFGRANAPLRITPTGGQALDTLLFDLDLGLRFAPNAAGGLHYRVVDHLAIRAEARLWLTLIDELIEDRIIAQKNLWLTLSAAWIF